MVEKDIKKALVELYDSMRQDYELNRKYLTSINQIYTMLFPTDTYRCLGCENNCNDCIPGGKNCHYMELTGKKY